MDMVEQLSQGKYTFDNVKSLLSSAKPGDVLQLDATNQHSMVIYSVNSSSMTVFDCDSDYHNSVYLHDESYSFGSSRNSAHMALLRSKNYSSVDGEVAAPAAAPALSICGATVPTALNVGDEYSLYGTITTDCGSITSVTGVY